jgi:hypothetical protein
MYSSPVGLKGFFADAEGKKLKQWNARPERRNIENVQSTTSLPEQFTLFHFGYTEPAVLTPRPAKERARFPVVFSATTKKHQWQCVLKPRRVWCL